MQFDEAVQIRLGAITLDANLTLPAESSGIVAFAHGSGSSRHSPRNRQVAEVLHRSGLGTLLADLLTAEEEERDLETRELRFDISLLAGRVTGLLDWLVEQPSTAMHPIGLFGASTGAAAALVAAAERPAMVRAVVSRGGRPDLAVDSLPRVAAPTLLVVGGNDTAVLQANRQVLPKLSSASRLEVVPGATHLFEEPGTLEHVAEESSAWFLQYLGRPPATPNAR